METEKYGEDLDQSNEETPSFLWPLSQKQSTVGKGNSSPFVAMKGQINPYSPDVSCLELAIASKIVDPNRNPAERMIFVYTLKVNDINRFVGAASPSSYYQG